MLSQYGYNQLVHIASWGLLSALLDFNAEMDDCAYICRGVWYVYMLTRFFKQSCFDLKRYVIIASMPVMSLPSNLLCT